MFSRIGHMLWGVALLGGAISCDSSERGHETSVAAAGADSSPRASGPSATGSLGSAGSEAGQAAASGAAGSAGSEAGQAAATHGAGAVASDAGQPAAVGDGAGGAGETGAGGAAARSGGGPSAELVDCDPGKIFCKMRPPLPECPAGQVRSVVAVCLGDCVEIERCRCSSNNHCPNWQLNGEGSCLVSAQHCTADRG